MAKNTYKDMDKWYKTKRENRKRYYEKTKNAANRKKGYTTGEVQMIMEHKLTDRELSEKLGRSMKAIQKKRYDEKLKLQKEKGNDE